MLLLDTDVVSGLRKEPVSEVDRRLMKWAQGMTPTDTFVSAISLLEVERSRPRHDDRDA